MEALLLGTSRSEWYERVQVFLVLATERMMSLRSGIFWTFSYVLLLTLMYLFHSPFRSQLESRTDWYAQLTKGLQIWLAVVLLCFHVGPHVVESPSTAAGATGTKSMASGATQHILAEDTVATIFFPIFCFSSSFCLLLHKIKRRYKLAFTYGTSLTVVLINSVLLSSFATMHYTTCRELFSTAETAVNASEKTRTTPAAGSLTLPLVWKRTSLVVCPQPAKEKPFVCIAFLCTLCVTFVGIDYLYKKHVAGGDPLRGILWADLYPEKQKSYNSSLASSSRTPFIFRCWGWRRAHVSDNHAAERLGLSEGDPRLQELTPKTIVLPSHAKHASQCGDGDTDQAGWQDEHDRLNVSDGKCVTQPTNRPGMVPWFSTFIIRTTWQVLARMSLEFLTFDIRVLQHYARPKVFELHFESSLKDLPSFRMDSKRNSMYANDKPTAADAATLSATCPPTPLQRDATQALKQPPSATSPEKRVRENDKDIWFDWISDVGDGFNPTYAMARLLARPFLKLTFYHPPSRRVGLSFFPTYEEVTPAKTPSPNSAPDVLPRGSFVLVGGDLAYPSPNDKTYTTRLFEPYHDAMSGNVRLQSVFHAEQQRVIVADASDADVAHVHLLDAETVSRMATGRAALRTGRATAEEALRSVPLLFAIPGNHDWFDGLTTFHKYILERTWIGGWLMPQRSSFFVLRLPHNWFILCGDTGNMQDIDVAQRNYFLDVIEKYMDVESCVILASHEPGWVYDAMEKDEKARQPELNRVVEALGTRLRLRLAGDIHHYSRHVPVDASSEAATLVVSGGGGAFLHGARDDSIISQGTKYVRACAFPDRNTFMNMASRLWGFRVINWKFDLVVGFMCFVLLLSVLPLPMDLDLNSRGTTHRGDKKMRLAQVFSLWVGYTTEIMSHVITRGIISLFSLVFFWVFFSSAGVDRHAPFLWRLCYGSVWAFAVLLCCSGAMAFLHVQLLYLMNHELLESTGGHWGSELENQVVFMTNALIDHLQSITGGEESWVSRRVSRAHNPVLAIIPTGCLRVLLRCFDPFESLSFLSMTVSGGEMARFSATASRFQILLYYTYVLFFYWVLITPIVSVLIGTFLLFSVTTFDYMYNPTYSAFQMEEYKHFVRFRLDAATRELHAYVVAVQKPATVYQLDRGYLWSLTGPGLEEHRPPHLKHHPSRWGPVPSDVQRKRHMTELLEHFTVYPHRGPQRSKPLKMEHE